MTFFFLICTKLVWQASSLTQTVICTVNALRWTYLHLLWNTSQYFNFTSIQKLFFQYPGLSCNLQLFYVSAFCHTCYSTSIKAGWVTKTLSSKEMFSSGSPGIIRTEVPFSYACTHVQKTHTANKIAARTLHWIHTNTQSITYVHMQWHQDVFVSLSLVSTGNLKSSFVRSLHMLPQLTYKGSELSWPWMTHTHTWTHTHTPFPHMCYDWQIDWPTDL